MAMWNNQMVSSHVGPKHVQPHWWWVSVHGDLARTGVLAADPGGTYEHLAGDRLGSSPVVIPSWRCRGTSPGLGHTGRPGLHRNMALSSRHGKVKTIENPDVAISCNFYVDTVWNGCWTHLRFPEGAAIILGLWRLAHTQTLVKISGEDAALFWTSTLPCFNIFRHI
jgi:hypothetical protein